MCEVGLSSVIVTKGISGVSLDGLIARRYEIRNTEAEFTQPSKISI